MTEGGIIGGFSGWAGGIHAQAFDVGKPMGVVGVVRNGGISYGGFGYWAPITATTVTVDAAASFALIRLANTIADSQD